MKAGDPGAGVRKPYSIALRQRESGLKSDAKRREGLVAAIQEADVPAEHVLDWFTAEFPNAETSELVEALVSISESAASFEDGQYAWNAVTSTIADASATPLEEFSAPITYEPVDSTRGGVFNALGLGRQSSDEIQDELVYSTKTGDNHPTQLGAKLEKALADKKKTQRSEQMKKIAGQFAQAHDVALRTMLQNMHAPLVLSAAPALGVIGINAIKGLTMDVVRELSDPVNGMPGAPQNSTMDPDPAVRDLKAQRAEAEKDLAEIQEKLASKGAEKEVADAIRSLAGFIEDVVDSVAPAVEQPTDSNSTQHSSGSTPKAYSEIWNGKRRHR